MQKEGELKIDFILPSTVYYKRFKIYDAELVKYYITSSMI